MLLTTPTTTLIYVVLWATIVFTLTFTLMPAINWIVGYRRPKPVTQFVIRNGQLFASSTLAGVNWYTCTRGNLYTLRVDIKGQPLALQSVLDKYHTTDLALRPVRFWQEV